MRYTDHCHRKLSIILPTVDILRQIALYHLLHGLLIFFLRLVAGLLGPLNFETRGQLLFIDLLLQPVFYPWEYPLLSDPIPQRTVSRKQKYGTVAQARATTSPFCS